MRSTGQANAHILLQSLAIIGALLVQSPRVAATDYSAELAAVEALGDLTTAPAIHTDDTVPGTVATLAAGDLKMIYYDALDYLGNPTRAYAWVGIPAGASAGSPVPGIVLVHGGGGTAFQTWVQKWNERGYAAISIAVEGQTDSTVPPTMNTGWHIHNMPGPVRVGIYGDSAVTPISDQWMYHAVADTVLANSLLRSLPEVDAAKVGLMGVSWGGVITSTAMGIDDRFKFAIPTYGCGHLYDAQNLYGGALGNNDLYKEVWDPMVRMANATMPALWYSWPTDFHFPMDNLAYSYHAAPGARMVSLVPGMGHGHGAAWNRPESYDFADSVVSAGAPWCEQQSVSVASGTASVVFSSTKPLHSASLVFATNSGVTTDLNWTETALAAPVESPAGTWTVSAPLPAGVTGWFVNVRATGSDTGNIYGYTDTNLTASSDYQENIALVLSPAGQLEIVHRLADDQTTGTVHVGFTGPTNVEISDVTISGESHPGAFSILNALPPVLGSPLPSTQPLDIRFDNTVAGLTDGQGATGMLTIVWENLDGSTDQVTLPLSATAQASVTVIYDTTADWSSQTVRSIDDVIIRNDATVTVGEAAGPNLLVNGSFETPDVMADGDPSPNGFGGYGPGNTSVTGWTIAGNNVYVIDGFDNFNADMNAVASDGDQFIQLQFNSSPSTISQTITTVAGQRYLLEFDYSALGFDSRTVILTYSTGGPDQTIDYTTIDLEVGQAPWLTESYEFTAVGTSTTISFTGDFFAGFWGPGIDNVSVRAAPVATAATITVNDDHSPTTATLEINQDFPLTATESIQLGAGTGAGFVNQSSGSVTTPDLTINASGTGDISRYSLSGGSLTLPQEGGVQVNAGGLLDIDGGTLIKDFNGSTTAGSLGTGAADGTIRVQSGDLQLVNGTVFAVIDLHSKLEISGGNVDLIAQVRARNEFKVIGDDATIDLGWLGTFSGSKYLFEFDATGVSPIRVAGWLSMADATIEVDGSSYTGGPGTFLLFDSAHLDSLADPGSITVTGFAEKGLSASVVQDQTDGNDWVQLVITLSPYGTWADGHGLSGPDAHTAANPDGDGMDNLMEFALGGNPNQADDSTALPTIADNAGAFEFTYTRRVNPASQGLAYAVKTSTDLIEWGTDGLGAPGVGPVVGGFESVTHTLQGGDHLFARLEVTLLE